LSQDKRDEEEDREVWNPLISLLASVPIISFDLVGIGAGLARMDPKHFLFSTFIGKFARYLLLFLGLTQLYIFFIG
jgi:membrane protein YqaA with SNARE-associated domain